jgi:Flp pilus assembly protein CpaB
VSWHRRKLAVVAVIAAVLTGISAARPPDPPSIQVVRTTHQLTAGAVLSAADVHADEIPRSAAPAGALAEVDAALGKTLTGPAADGQVITDLDLGAPRASPGSVVAPLRLTDTDVVGLLGVGDRVDVIAAGESGGKAKVVASNVLVVGLPRPADDGGLAGSSPQGALVLVQVDLDTATALNEAVSAGRLDVVLR